MSRPPAKRRQRRESNYESGVERPESCEGVVNERTRLLRVGSRDVEREDTITYATHTPEVPIEEEHYNLAGLSQFNFWVLCVSMWSCSFLSSFDGTIVATLLGPISSSFNASDLGSWLGTAYLLSVCCFTPIYGRLCDIVGRQNSMLIALGFFSLGNVLCAVAPTMEFLIGARMIAGIGGGGLTSVGSTIMSDLVPITHRGIFQGYGNIMFGMGSGLGAPIGGMISDKLGWRWAFYLQIPLLIGAGLLIFFKVRYGSEIKHEGQGNVLARIDFLGSGLLAACIGCALLGISLKTAISPPESKVTTTLFIISAVAGVLFLYVELKVAREPILPVELLTQRTPIAVAINNFVISILSFGVLYSVPLYFQAVRLMSATEAGQHMVPNSILGSIGSLWAGFVVRRTGRYWWLTVFCGSWAVVAALLLSTWDLNTGEFLLWTSFCPMAFAMGSVTTLTIVGLIADIGREHVAVATSLSYMFRTSGQVLGVALSGALTQAVLSKELKARITGPGSAEIIERIRRSSEEIRKLSPELQLTATTSYGKALHAVFVCSVVLAAIGVLSGMGMREVPMTPAPKPVIEDVSEEEEGRPRSYAAVASTPRD